MDTESLLYILLLGGIAGWVASLLVKGHGMGCAVNIVVGIIGAFLGSYLFDVLGITAGGTLGSLAMATVGAVVLLALLSLVTGRR